MKQKKYNHLFKVPNTDEGRAFIAQLKHYMKDTESRHRIRLKGRNPIIRAKDYNGGRDGGIRLAEAKNIAVYLKEDTNSYNRGYEASKRSNEWSRNQAINQGYERGYNEAWNDAKEYFMNQVREIAKNEQ